MQTYISKNKSNKGIWLSRNKVEGYDSQLFLSHCENLIGILNGFFVVFLSEFKRTKAQAADDVRRGAHNCPHDG